jgi:hypothetical protein
MPNNNNEEEKKSEEEELTEWPHLPCYDVPEISQIRYDGKLQFKKDTYYVERFGE